ncbi:hypothetical protein KCV01_g12841, partial [Aureobasidium melanogenum]
MPNPRLGSTDRLHLQDTPAPRASIHIDHLHDTAAGDRIVVAGRPSRRIQAIPDAVPALELAHPPDRHRAVQHLYHDPGHGERTRLDIRPGLYRPPQPQEGRDTDEAENGAHDRPEHGIQHEGEEHDEEACHPQQHAAEIPCGHVPTLFLGGRALGDDGGIALIIHLEQDGCGRTGQIDTLQHHGLVYQAAQTASRLDELEIPVIRMTDGNPHRKELAAHLVLGQAIALRDPAQFATGHGLVKPFGGSKYVADISKQAGVLRAEVHRQGKEACAYEAK